MTRSANSSVRATVRKFSDLPREPGRHVLMTSVGRGQLRRDIPIWWQVGNSLQPCLAVTAMIHGDEFEGFAAVRQFWEKLRGVALRGSVLVLPICNPWAAESATRCTPTAIDGANLARTF